VGKKNRHNKKKKGGKVPKGLNVNEKQLEGIYAERYYSILKKNVAFFE